MSWMKESIMMTKGVGKDSKGETHHLTEKKQGTYQYTMGPYSEPVMHIKPGENAWNSNLPEHLKLNVAKTRLSHIYKRLHPDKPAYTVTGSGGGGTHMYHWDEPRALTNRERARLQTFPDNFIFEGSKESVRKQIGMAVPPEGARIIFESVLKSLGNAGVDPNA